MKYKLVGANKKENYFREILDNRKIDIDYNKYLYTTDADINSYFLLDNIEAACSNLHKHLENNDPILLLVDCDVDGITSSAVLWNFIKQEINSKANLHFVVHEGKQHGLSDTIDYIIQKDCKLIVVPDAGSNDFIEQKRLKDLGVDILVLDHHDCDTYSKQAIIVNNQMSKNYPNKNLSGVGVVWQFLRCYNDMFLDGKVEMANYLDLVALGNTADQMSLTSLETKHLIHKGFVTLRNQMIINLCSAQAYSMKNVVSAFSVAWYISPMLNSVCRVGTLEEKKNLFRAFLSENKDLEVPSTKRNHLVGDMENFTIQQIRTAQNIRNRQNKLVESKMTMILNLIETNHLDKHKLLLIDIPENSMPPEIIGLIANKIASQFKQPTAILRQVTGEDSKKLLMGSIRNFESSPIEDFRKELEDSGLIIYAQGHPSAAGLALFEKDKEKLLNYFDTKWSNIEFSPSYNVDFVFDYLIDEDILEEAILKIAFLNKYNLWGQDMPEPKIVIKNLPVDNCMLLGKSQNTMRLTCKNFEVMKFFISSEEYHNITETPRIDAIGTCSENVWLNKKTSQLILIAYSPSEQKEQAAGWARF